MALSNYTKHILESGMADTGAATEVIAAIDANTAASGADAPTVGAGTKNGATVTVTETGDELTHKTVLTCVNTPITMGDEAGVGQYGGAKLYDFPAGLIATLGGVIDGSVTTPVHDDAAGGTIATWDGDIALGTAAPTDHATGLVAADTGRYLQSTATTQAIGQAANVDAVSAATGLTESGARWTDGTSSAADLFLNLLVDDSANNDAHTALFTGTITIVWMNIGDK